MTIFEEEMMLSTEKKKASVSLISLHLKPLYIVEVAKKLYPVGYAIPQFLKFDERSGNTKEYVVRFLVQHITRSLPKPSLKPPIQYCFLSNLLFV